MRAVALILCVLAISGCRGATAIKVHVETDVPCDELHSVGISVGGPDHLASDTAPSTTSCESSADGDSYIGSLTVVPSGAKDASVGIIVRGGVHVAFDACVPPAYSLPDPEVGDGCIVARRTLRFIPNEELLLPIALRKDCVAEPCEEDSTCVRGRCADRVISDSAACLSDMCDEDSLAVTAAPSCEDLHPCWGDADGDGDIDFGDISFVTAAVGSVCGDANFNAGADFDGDGDVDRVDLLIFRIAINNCVGCDWQCTGCGVHPCPGDANGDGVVDIDDSNMVTNAFSTTCGSPGYLLTADFNADGIIDNSDLQIVSGAFGETSNCLIDP